MKISPTAIPYAKALFDLAKERNELEAVMKDMQVIASISSSNKDFMMLLKSPIIHSDKKIKIIREVFRETTGVTTLTFLEIIIRKKREKFIPEIALAFQELYQDYNNILVTHVKTAAPITTEIREEIIRIMKEHTSKTIELEEEIDKDLIGGFVLNWKDKQYDASILSQINQLKKNVARINLFVKKI
ncbi:MAG: ATP synthase F1 subunit delta [Syntrophothermus sp.]